MLKGKKKRKKRRGSRNVTRDNQKVIEVQEVTCDSSHRNFLLLCETDVTHHVRYVFFQVNEDLEFWFVPLDT